MIINDKPLELGGNCLAENHRNNPKWRAFFFSGVDAEYWTRWCTQAIYTKLQLVEYSHHEHNNQASYKPT